MISLIRATLSSYDNESGEDAIRVAGVVVVRSAGSVDIAEVRGVADIRRSQPNIHGGNSL